MIDCVRWNGYQDERQQTYFMTPWHVEQPGSPYATLCGRLVAAYAVEIIRESFEDRPEGLCITCAMRLPNDVPTPTCDYAGCDGTMATTIHTAYEYRAELHRLCVVHQNLVPCPVCRGLGERFAGHDDCGPAYNDCTACDCKGYVEPDKATEIEDRMAINVSEVS